MTPTTTSKRCPGCCKEGEALPVSKFYRYRRADSEGKLVYSSYCKKCHQTLAKIQYRKKVGGDHKVRLPPEYKGGKQKMTRKRCPGCCEEGETLPVSDFYWYRRAGREGSLRCSGYCKKCHKVLSKRRYEKRAGKPSEARLPREREATEARVRRFNSFDFIPPVKERMAKLNQNKTS